MLQPLSGRFRPRATPIVRHCGERLTRVDADQVGDLVTAEIGSSEKQARGIRYQELRRAANAWLLDQ